MIYTAEQARRKTVIACQTALAKRGVAVLIVPADISASAVRRQTSLTRYMSQIPSSDRATLISRRSQKFSTRAKISLFTADRAARGRTGRSWPSPTSSKRRSLIRRAAKDFLEFDNPYNVGMTGMLGNEAGYHALLRLRHAVDAGRRLCLAAILSEQGKDRAG